MSPITTTFNKNAYVSSTEAILREFLQDWYPTANYVVAFEQPAKPTKHTIWIEELPGANRQWLEHSGTDTVQNKQLRFAVSMLSYDRPTAVSMAETFERHAVLASSSALGNAGLSHARVTPFYDTSPDDVQPKTYRRTGILSLTVETSKK